MMKECKDWRGGRAGLEVRRKGMNKEEGRQMLRKIN